MSDGKSVLERVVANSRRSRKIKPGGGCTTDQLIDRLEERDLTQEQALRLEEMLLSIPEKEGEE